MFNTSASHNFDETGAVIGPTGALPPPLKQIYFYLNRGHNLACRACWAHKACDPPPDTLPSVPRHPTGGLLLDARQTSHLPVDLFEQALREAIPMGLQSVKLTGGEPLLHPHLDDLLDVLAATQLHVIIETNGSGLSPALAERLAHLPRVEVALGLEGASAETHDRLRGKSGSFAVVTQAARALSQAGLKPDLIFSLVRENASEVNAFIPLAEALGAGSVQFYLVHTGTTDGGSPLAVEELIALGRRVERELAPATRLRLVYDQPPAFRGLNPQGPTPVHGRCGVLNAISVLTDGSYALCGVGFLSPELIFGPVGTHPLAALWRANPILRQLRDGMPNRLEGVCQRCVMKNSCMGNCVIENYMNSHSFWGPFWFCEAAERVRLFPAHRLTDH